MAQRRDISSRARAAVRAARLSTFHVDGTTSPVEGFRFLVASGFASHEAGNLTALVSGLRPTVGAWTVAEISRLGFLLLRVKRYRIEP